MPEQPITLHPVSDLERREIIRALNRAYADYYVPIQLTEASFRDLVQRESVLLDVSQAAIDEGEVVGIGMLGMRGDRGWIGGMGVIPAYRRQGIARRILHRLIDEANGRGLRTLQLEVIAINQGAYALYRDMGFETVRTLHVLRSGGTPSAAPTAPLALTFRTERAAGLLERVMEFPAPRRPWQRELTALAAQPLHAMTARSRAGNELQAVCLYRDDSTHKDIVDLVATSLEAGRALAVHMLRSGHFSRMSFLNVADDDPLLPMLPEAGFREALAQYEMLLNLAGSA